MQKTIQIETFPALYVNGTLSVLPNVLYEVKIQILHLEVNNSSREATSIVLDGHNMGSCHPNGTSNCEFYNCSDETNRSNLTKTTIEPKNETIELEIYYNDPVENGSACFCNTSDYSCNKTMASHDLTPVTASAHITLTMLTLERTDGE